MRQATTMLSAVMENNQPNLLSTWLLRLVVTARKLSRSIKLANTEANSRMKGGQKTSGRTDAPNM
ncbi:hypothetical protein CU110_09615 [Cobetia sp. ICG0124]|nr:hypothetical protein CU110_09615 [Cobetia sp. ICG0124]